MGTSGRIRVSELCDSKRNVKKLAEIFIAGRWANWHEKLRKLEEQRSSYTAERENYYTDCRVRAVNYFQPGAGRLLEIGCGLGKLRFHLPAGVEYYGCDVLADKDLSGAFPFAAARAENLPFKENAFDAIVFYAVLIHVFDVDRALAEAARILKPGGRLYLQECYDDANPIHMNRFSGASLRARIEERFDVISSHPANEYLMMMVATKPYAQTGGPATLGHEAQSPQPGAESSNPPERQLVGNSITVRKQIAHQSQYLPLVSICITTYNRAEFVKTSIDSVLQQTYRNVEVIVVDDGSTDDTRRVLESYGSALRVAYNERNRGIAFSKNRSLTMSLSEARYVGILDSDDYYDPHFVERCVDCLERQPEVGLVYTDDIMVDAQGNRLWTQPAVEPWDIDTWLRTRNLRGDTWLARRALVMQTRLHDAATEPDEDYDLFYQLLELTTFAHVREFLVFIRQHEGRTTTLNRLALTRAHAANLVKHGYSAEYAYLRARNNPEWIPAIEEGIDLGHKLREQWRSQV
jgi:SAM-dependent methyltransferase